MLKKFLSLFILSISLYSANGQKIADGYIINLKNDTIPGKINLQKFKDGGFYKPFNWGMFSLSLTFIPQDGQEKEYSPRDIKGFDFDYSGEHYEFRPLKIGTDELQSFFSDDAPSEIFAQMVIKDSPISLYAFRFNYDVFRRYKGRSDKNVNYYINYYVKKPSGLVRINRTFKNNELSTILKDDLQLEESFIETVPKNYNISKLAEVIDSYNAWKKQKKS